ncbi:hypothetical protein Vadar_005350 [Vaccinium darrowii]|nr:hypothetical protein Vadar_005350 [Vaccinium darrowii]
MEENIDENLEQCSSSTVRRKRSTSAVWDDFDKLPPGVDGKKWAKCNYCGQKYRRESGTSSLLHHNCPNKDSHDFHPSIEIDQERYRQKMAMAIIKHNYPFKFVEHEGIRDIHSYLNPAAKSVSRNTAKADVLKLFEREKINLKGELESVASKICLTSDLWSSLTSDGYLALTAHYIDENWVLQKKILNFRHVPPPHNGPILAERVIHLLKDWGIDKKIFSLTLDNAKYNDGLVDVLKRHISLSNSLVCDGQFFHIRCGAHVLNLIVQEGLKVIDEAIYNIRESVKYVRGSEGRKIKFAECIAQLPSSCSKKVRQDIMTRWNSTYLMLECALVHRLAYSQLQLVDTNYRTCPSEDEWLRVERISRFLRPFYEITTLFSGSRYPTANLYFHGVWKIQFLIKEEMENFDDLISSMARRMKGKFDKYWECYSTVLSFAIILDPRYKLQFVEFCFLKLDLVNCSDRIKTIREKLYLLFEDYVSRSTTSTSNQSSSACDTSGGNQNDPVDVMDEFDVFESQECGLGRVKSELDLYLEEPRLERKKNVDLDILCGQNIVVEDLEEEEEELVEDFGERVAALGIT